MTDINKGSAANGKVKRERSPAFPFIPLKTAISRLEAFETTFKRHSVPAKHSGQAWSMKGWTSQAQQTLAALKAFGLIEYRGSGESLEAFISDEGRTYLRAQQEHIKKEVLKRCALKPKIIASTYELWGADRPPDAVCLDHLVLKGGFNEAGAKTFLHVYDETIVYAGLSDSDRIDVSESSGDGDDEYLTPSPEAKVGDMVQWTSGGVDHFASPAKVIAVSDDRAWLWVAGSGTGIPMSQIHIVSPGGDASPPPMPPHLAVASEGLLRSKPGMKEEKNSLDEGEAILILPENLSPESVRDLQYWLEGILKKAKRRAGLRGPDFRQKLAATMRANMATMGVAPENISNEKIEDIIDLME